MPYRRQEGQILRQVSHLRDHERLRRRGRVLRWEIASGDVRDSVGVGGSEREIHAGGDNAAFRAEESLRAALLGLLGSPDYTPIRRGELCELMAPDDERTDLR